MQKKMMAKRQVARECKAGERVGMDLTSCQEESIGKNHCARAMTDCGSEKMWVEAMDKKSRWPKLAMTWLQKMEVMGRVPKNVRMDGAGENKKFKNLAKEK